MGTVTDTDALEISVETVHAVVKYIDILHSADDILVLEIGTDHKDPQWGISGNEIWLWPPHEDYTSCPPRDGGVHTTVRLPPRTGGWCLITDAMKYGLYVTALPFKDNDERTSIQFTEREP